MTDTYDRSIDTSWHERYRPQALGEMALDPAVRRQVERHVNGRTLSDHLLLFGSPGTGKTTLAKIIIKHTGCLDVRELNASKDRGIEVIRGVETFAKTYAWGGKSKIVFMDEADGLTAEAQDAMRGLMEKYSFQTKFIFTANNVTGLSRPIRDRFEEIEMNRPPAEECAPVVDRVLRTEGVELEFSEILKFVVNHFASGEHRTLRTLLRATQQRWEPRSRPTADRAEPTGSVIELLTDIRRVFESAQADRLRSSDLVARLQALDGRPWKEMKLDPSKLSKMLRPLGVRPVQIWFDRGTPEQRNKQGYLLSQFQGHL